MIELTVWLSEKGILTKSSKKLDIKENMITNEIQKEGIFSVILFYLDVQKIIIVNIYLEINK